MTVQTKPVTAEELLRLPDDGFRYELVKGELRQMAPAGSKHGYLALEIGSELRSHVKSRQLGMAFGAETGFKLSSDPDTVRAPDVAFVGRERLGGAGLVDGYWLGAPDLAVEIVSPSDKYSEVEEKALEWLSHGTRLVLVVDPRNKTITAYRSREDIRILTADDTLDADGVVLGWTLSLAELFA